MRLLITGSNRGLGWGIAEYFHAKGVEIVSLNRTLRNVDWLNEVQCDLEDMKQVEIALGKVENIEEVDICVFNAAVRKFGLIHEMDVKDWCASVNINLTSVFYLLQRLIPSLRRNEGYAFFIGSQAATNTFEEGAAYSSTKAALKALVETMIKENRNYGVRATLLNLGAIKNRKKPNDDWKMKPEELANLMYRLALSDRNLLIGELEVSPAQPPEFPLYGIDRLQSI